MEYLYHGSCMAGITKLQTISRLHNTQELVVYLTDFVPYALYFIWDIEHNLYQGKFVTGSIRDGIAYYEEVFPNQLKELYQGVSGYLYCIEKKDDFQPVVGREGMYCSHKEANIAKVIKIADVYEELLKYEAMGKFIVLRYNEQKEERQRELVEKYANFIKMKNFFQDNENKRGFYQRYLTESWALAEKM